MTKYDRIFNSDEVLAELLSPEEAVVAIAVITTTLDTSLEEIDVESLGYILWEFEIFAEYAEEEVLEIIDRMIAIARTAGLGPLFNTANASLTVDTVLDAFAAGVILLLDDENLIIPSQYQPYLQQLQAALELETEEADEIIEEIIDAIQETETGESTENDCDIIIKESGEKIYESPMQNFQVLIPVDIEQGGRINSQDGTVSFSDDLGTFLRIDYYLLPPEQLDEIELIGSNRYLETILFNIYVPQAIFNHLSTANIKYAEYLNIDIGNAYFVLVDMPKGSTISKQENNGTGIRLDAYRGILAFVKGEFLYIVNSQRNFFDGETPGSNQEEAEELKNDILDFIDTIEFTEM
ncbi:MAG TPA: tellurite resistance TerB family protein [Nostocaceae cyanobacterium]|nr:tellurite resistance TerB family protein [Nostocaceae cyanobacterium]